MAYIGQTPTAVPLVAGDFADGSISEAKLGPDAVSLAKMKAGTDGNIISYDASGNPVAIATGSDGQVLTSAGAGAPPAFEAAAGITLGTPVATTSGTSIDFTGIPSGTKKITINLESLSTNGASLPIIQIGDSGGFENAGYLGCASFISNVTPVSALQTAGFALVGGWSGTVIPHGSVVLSLLDAATYTWVSSSVLGRGVSLGVYPGGGSKSLTAELTQVRLTTVGGSNAFDLGKMNIQYE